MGYGPVTPRGYGCSYNPHPEQIVFCVSAFYSCEDTSASRYAKSLQDSAFSITCMVMGAAVGRTSIEGAGI